MPPSPPTPQADAERHRLWRQLDALTLAARDLAERAVGSADRAAEVEACLTRAEALTVHAPDAPEAAEGLAALPDPPTARILLHRLRAGGAWPSVLEEARRLADRAREAADADAREAAETERMRAEAERRVEAHDQATGRP